MRTTHKAAGVAAAALATIGGGAYTATQAAPGAVPKAVYPQPAQQDSSSQASAFAQLVHEHALAARHSSRPARHARVATSYRVKPGDTLSQIAARFCGDPSRYLNLASANDIADPNVIDAGQVLRLACHAALKAALASYNDPVLTTTSATPSSGQGSPQAHVTGLSGTLSYAGLEALWEAAGGPAWAAPAAAAVAECESGGQQYAYNPSGATGYWQILGQVVFTGKPLTDPLTNAENAVSKFEASGGTFAQWVCQP